MDAVTLAAAKAYAKRASAPATAVRPIVYHPWGLRRWRKALGDVFAAADGLDATGVKQPSIVCLGDSYTAGHYSNNATNGVQAEWPKFRARGWVPILRRLMANGFGDPGEGFIFLSTPAINANFVEERITISASTSSPTIGPQKTGRSITSGQTITLTTPACTKVGIMGWWAAGTSAAFTYTVDGGGSQNGPTQSGSDTSYTHWITGLANTTHTIVVSGPATLRADIAGFFCETGVGVRVHRIGKGGGTIIDAAATDQSGTSQARILNASIVQPAADLVIVMLRHNDHEQQVALGTTPTLFQTGLQAIVTKAVANGACVLLVPDMASTVTSLTYSLADYKAAMLAVADANDHVAVLDIDDLWVDYATSNALGLRQDTVHPNSKGHGDIGRILFRVLTGLGMGENV